MVARQYLVPGAAALVTVDGGRAEVVGQFGGRWSATFEGALADDVARLAEAGELSPRLAALAGSHRAASALAQWQGERWLPLTALDAVRLDGWGTLFLELVGTCNERCLHCYAESSPTVKDALDQATCEAVIDDAARLGFERLQLTGGDPLLCPFLPDLVARAAGRFVATEVYTNGLLLGDRLLDRLAPHRPQLAFSYYACDPAVHDAITRTPGSQRRTRAAIERVLARGLVARASIVVMAENQALVDATIDELRGLGVAHVAVSGSRAVGRGGDHDYTAAEGGGHRAAGPRREGKLAVTYTGEVVPCIFNRRTVLARVGPRERLADALASLAAPGRRRLPQADPARLTCATCRLTELALGAVR
jgi:MoaA/NifB/PqqE/SkfB family radical SAM enzyme